MNANITGKITVQQKDINWSNLILGKDALTQININTIMQLLTAKLILYSIFIIK